MVEEDVPSAADEDAESTEDAPYETPATVADSADVGLSGDDVEEEGDDDGNADAPEASEA